MNNAIVKEEKSGVCSLTLNRPEKRNVLNCEMIMLLGDAVNEAASSGKSRVLILRGSDGRAFCAGGDLMESRIGNFSQFIKAIEYFQKSLIHYPFPAIAMIRGAAIGLGLGRCNGDAVDRPQNRCRRGRKSRTRQ